MICITLNDLCNVELFFTSLQNLCHLEWFEQRWIICTKLNDSECDGWFVQHWIIWTRMNYWVLVFYWVSGVLIQKNTVRYFTVNFELIFRDLEISRRNIFGPAPEIGHKEMFLITLVETLSYVFSRHTLEFQMEGEGGINGKAGKFRSK